MLPLNNVPRELVGLIDEVNFMTIQPQGNDEDTLDNDNEEREPDISNQLLD
jgi:hypothetical protein